MVTSSLLVGKVVGDDDDVEFHVLGCRVHVLGTNCEVVGVIIASLKLVR